MIKVQSLMLQGEEQYSDYFLNGKHQQEEEGEDED